MGTDREVLCKLHGVMQVYVETTTQSVLPVLVYMVNPVMSLLYFKHAKWLQELNKRKVFLNRTNVMTSSSP